MRRKGSHTGACAAAGATQEHALCSEAQASFTQRDRGAVRPWCSVDPRVIHGGSDEHTEDVLDTRHHRRLRLLGVRDHAHVETSR